MDDDTIELIQQLCTRVGMIMEDASPVALITEPADDLSEKVEALRRATSRASALVAAADALCSVPGL